MEDTIRAEPRRARGTDARYDRFEVAPRDPRITPATRLLGLIGDPVEHSLSPAMQNAALRSLGLPFVYLAFRVERERVPEALGALRALGVAGLNVTVPHKQAVLPLLDRLSPTARACGAVNVIVPRAGRLLGENTDVYGLERDLDEHGAAGRFEKAVVLGAGGAARAAVVALSRRARRVVVAARRPERAAALVAELAVRRARVETVPFADLGRRSPVAADVLRSAAVVVNATSAGLRGEPFPSLSAAAAPPDCLFYDLVYTARETPFMALARRSGRRAVNGLGMLLHQGARAFELFTGEPAPVAVMRRALR